MILYAFNFVAYVVDSNWYVNFKIWNYEVSAEGNSPCKLCGKFHTFSEQFFKPTAGKYQYIVLSQYDGRLERPGSLRSPCLCFSGLRFWSFQQSKFLLLQVPSLSVTISTGTSLVLPSRSSPIPLSETQWLTPPPCAWARLYIQRKATVLRVAQGTESNIPGQ